MGTPRRADTSKTVRVRRLVAVPCNNTVTSFPRSAVQIRRVLFSWQEWYSSRSARRRVVSRSEMSTLVAAVGRAKWERTAGTLRVPDAELALPQRVTLAMGRRASEHCVATQSVATSTELVFRASISQEKRPRQRGLYLKRPPCQCHPHAVAFYPILAPPTNHSDETPP